MEGVDWVHLTDSRVSGWLLGRHNERLGSIKTVALLIA